MIDREVRPDIEQRFSQLNVVVMGLPGSGKTSLMESLSTKPNYLSLGDITRAELANNGPMSEAIRSQFEHTEPWQPDFVVSIVAPHILEARNIGRGFVLDGVPRKASEADALVRWLADNDITVDLALYLDIDPIEAIKRISGRDNTGRLETIAHYTTRMGRYLAEEQEMKDIMSANAVQTLSIDTNNNPQGFAKSILLDFVASKF